MFNIPIQSNRPAIPAPITQGSKRNWRLHPKRHGMTLVETIAAATLLTVALGLAVKVIAASSSAEQAAQHKALATEILSSLLEKQLCRPAEELSQQKAAKWGLPFALKVLLPKAKLESEVTSVPGPPAGKKVTLKLTWQESSGKRSAPLVLSAWTYSYTVEEQNP